MKATVAALFLIFACTSASNDFLERKPSHQVGGDECIDAIVSAGGTLVQLYNDVVALAGGDISHLEAVIADVKAIGTDINSIKTACGLGKFYGISANCQSDINTVVATI